MNELEVAFHTQIIILEKEQHYWGDVVSFPYSECQVFSSISNSTFQLTPVASSINMPTLHRNDTMDTMVKRDKELANDGSLHAKGLQFCPFILAGTVQ